MTELNICKKINFPNGLLKGSILITFLISVTKYLTKATEGRGGTICALSCGKGMASGHTVSSHEAEKEKILLKALFFYLV